MTKKTAMEQYIGTTREAKREAWIGGADATLDVVMKELDKAAKAAVKTGGQKGALLASAFQLAANTIYSRTIKEVIAKSPFEPDVSPRAYSVMTSHVPSSTRSADGSE